MSKREPSGRQTWGKVYVPPHVADVFFMIAKKEGYERESAHKLLLDMLMTLYPAEVEELKKYVGWPED